MEVVKMSNYTFDSFELRVCFWYHSFGIW